MSLVVWIALALIILTMVVQYILGNKLYSLPKDGRYFNNISHVNTINAKSISAEPQYVIALSILCGIAMGGIVFLVGIAKLSYLISIFFSVLIFCFYLSEISRRISLSDYNLILSSAFKKDIIIPIDDINGMYIYSFNKKLLNAHAFTTKLVIVTDGRKYKFVISSINNKAVLNMMKNNFGIVDNKIYFESRKNRKDTVIS